MPLRSHLNGLHIYDPDTFRIVRLNSTRLNGANPQQRPQSSSFWFVGNPHLGIISGLSANLTLRAEPSTTGKVRFVRYLPTMKPSKSAIVVSDF